MIFRFFLVSLLLAFSFAAQASKGKGKKGISCNEVKKTPMTDEGDESLLRKLSGEKNSTSRVSSQRQRTRKKIEDLDTDSSPSEISYSNNYGNLLTEGVAVGGKKNFEILRDLAKKAKFDSKAREELNEIIGYTGINYGRQGALSRYLHDTKANTFFESPDHLNKAIKTALKSGRKKLISETKDKGLKKYEVTVGKGKSRSVYEMTVCSRPGCGGGKKVNEMTAFKPKCGPGVVRAPSRKELVKGLREPTAILKYINTDYRCP